MRNKKLFRKSQGSIFGLIFLVLIVLAAGYALTHKKEVKSFIRKETPVAQKAVAGAVAAGEKVTHGNVEAPLLHPIRDNAPHIGRCELANCIRRTPRKRRA